MIRSALKTHLDQDPFFKWRGFAGWLLFLIWPASHIIQRTYPMPSPDADTGGAGGDVSKDAP